LLFGAPFGVDAAGYLRMMVRQARLEPTPAPRPVLVTQPGRGFVVGAPTPPLLAAMGIDDGVDAGPPGGEVDVDEFAAAALAAAEASGMIAPPDQAQAPTGGVVLIGERRNRTAKEWAAG
jgi:hypothetical protein